MSKLKLAIIGAGVMAKRHLGVLALMEDITVVGITSRTLSKAQVLATEYGISVCAPTIEEMIRQCHPDALLVLVSEDQTEQVVSAIMAYRLPLFIEKPPGLNLQQAEGLADLARRFNVMNMVGFNRRYYSVFHQGLDLIKKHGRLLGIAIQGHERIWLQHQATDKHFLDTILPNWIYANSTHTIDLIRFFAGEPQELKILSRSIKEPCGDQFVAAMSFANGTLGTYQAHWYSPGGWMVALYGEGITVEFKPLEKGIWIDQEFKSHDIVPQEMDVRFRSGLFAQMRAFINLAKNKEKAWPLSDLEDSLKTMRLAEKFKEQVQDAILLNE